MNAIVEGPADGADVACRTVVKDATGRQWERGAGRWRFGWWGDDGECWPVDAPAYPLAIIGTAHYSHGDHGTRVVDIAVGAQ